jgi:RimJ/RimL family protein N-acetyltransferase
LTHSDAPSLPPWPTDPPSSGQVVLRRFEDRDAPWTLPELHRIELHIEPWNTASAGAAMSAGFASEGLLRSYLEIDGLRRDLTSYAPIRGLPPTRESAIAER